VLSPVSGPLLPTGDGATARDLIGYASGATVFATAGQTVTSPVAHLNLIINASVQARVSFQDGSLGVLQTTDYLSAGSYDLTAPHTYAEPGTYNNTVTITIADLASVQVSSPAYLAPRRNSGFGRFVPLAPQTAHTSSPPDATFVPPPRAGWERKETSSGAGQSTPIFGALSPPSGQGSSPGSSQGVLTGQIPWVKYPEPAALAKRPLESSPQTEVQVRRLEALSFLMPLAVDGPALLVPGALRTRAQQVTRRRVPGPAEAPHSVPASEIVVPAVVLGEEHNGFEDAALAAVAFTRSQSDPSAPARALGHDLTPARIPLLGRVVPMSDDMTIRAEEDDEPVAHGLPAAYFGLLEPSKETDPDETRNPDKHDVHYSGLLLAVYLFLVFRTLRGN
jgi:hypothetical protein